MAMKQGGAHYHTVTTPCKSIFPESWDTDKIINVTEKIAANDNLEWRKRKNGNKFAHDTQDGIIVRVIMDTERKYVITSYPLNAGRTPCPKNKRNVPATKYLGDKANILGNIEIEHKHDYNE
ncbi:MAG: EndoU domain-containing protein [Alphaproteobacteria bacterium]|nr:EndoU domain-containing protein [Alphaproteobacteria bacterium]